MDWFERLTGFREKSYADTKTKLVVDNGDLRSLVNGKSYRIGALELVSLRDPPRAGETDLSPVGKVESQRDHRRYPAHASFA